ncbi:MAG TPA: hypothetical protein PK734_00680 [Bacteroidales bacterium]|nr:MAG: hypothetical protein BWY22_01437 [Bacteroidetes bacterium ADurb.Bin217]HPM11985.1 hypothetical protein [Bacteroidales bacterium]
MKFLFYIISIITLFSCKKLITYDSFSLEKTEYKGSSLRIDGYYYQKETNNEYCRLECYYSDGVLLHMGGQFTTFEEMDNYVNSVFIQKKVQTNDKESWGLFIIENNVIKTERYYPTDQFRKPLYIREGHVLNDSTFHISVSYRSNGTEWGTNDETYHFRKYSPKPDSTQTFL